MGVKLMARHDKAVGRQAVVVLVVGNRTLEHQARAEIDPGGVDGQGRAHRAEAIHCRQDTQTARLDEIATDLLAREGLPLDDRHLDPAPGERPGHD